jgi:hypothetical protein
VRRTVGIGTPAAGSLTTAAISLQMQLEVMVNAAIGGAAEHAPLGDELEGVAEPTLEAEDEHASQAAESESVSPTPV